MEHRGDIERLSELLWRTFKFRASLLVFAIVVLIVAHSALADGDLHARDEDIKFCQQLIEGSNNLSGRPVLSADVFCTPQGARNYNEAQRWAVGLLSPSSLGDAENGKLRELYKKGQDEMTAYDARRAAAYSIQIQLPAEFPSTNVKVNVLTVARFGLFFALVVFFLVVLWGFQQDAYRRRIEALSDGEGGQARLSLSQFFAAYSSRKSGFLRYFIISPEKVAVLLLWITVGGLFISVFLSLVGSLGAVHLTDSIFLNYPFALYATAFFLSCVLVVNRTWYKTTSGQTATHACNHRRMRFFRWLCLGLAAIAFTSLFLPWLTFDDFGKTRGYHLLLKQYPVSEFGAYKFYSIDPHIFRELKFQLILAFTFILICVVNGFILRRIRTRWAIRTLRYAERFIAGIVLFLAFNLLFYMGILEYETEVIGQTSAVGMGAFVRGLEVHERGLQLDAYNPGYGFIIFLICCLLIIWISFRNKKEE
jgi:hypothetical protein